MSRERLPDVGVFTSVRRTSMGSCACAHRRRSCDGVWGVLRDGTALCRLVGSTLPACRQLKGVRCCSSRLWGTEQADVAHQKSGRHEGD